MKTVLKILSFTVGCFIILLMAVASNSKWMGQSEKHFPNPYRYGDLYLLSSMPGFRSKGEPDLIPPNRQKNDSITLTVIGDSYVDGFDPEFFAADYRCFSWGEIPRKISPLDPNKRNILIVECTERNIRWRFLNTDILSIGTNPQQIHEEGGGNIELAAEDNLQFMLTHQEWQLPFKELKTSIYLNCFDKFSPMVDKPDGNGRLYLKETVDPESAASGFNAVSEEEIKKIVESLNQICREHRALGFDEVYISLVPNTSSLYKKTNLPYNHLIERIEESPEAEFECIDVYKTFITKNKSLYHINDTHWNSSGKAIWLEKVDSLLNKK